MVGGSLDAQKSLFQPILRYQNFRILDLLSDIGTQPLVESLSQRLKEKKISDLRFQLKTNSESD